VEDSMHGFRSVPRTGVIFVTSEAERCGYKPTDSDWCNLGQGQPETGMLTGAPPRLNHLSIAENAYEYAPVGGLRHLREAVADFYNRWFRYDKQSFYTAENVAICGGGRLALARTAVALGEINLGHFLPDYTAYEELLGVFRMFNPIPIALSGDNHYTFGSNQLRQEIVSRGLSALLLSNPCNPTGKVVRGEALRQWVQAGRELDCTLIFDEFYSHYVYGEIIHAQKPFINSAAAFVEHVDEDPVIIIDGLTKNWRYPGLRLSWTVGPKNIIDGIISAGSFLDGGGSRPVQEAAIALLTDEYIKSETSALQKAFYEKRLFFMNSIRQLGIGIESEPEGGFYIWADVSGLPSGWNTGMDFFKSALKEKIICVPGQFFDINPGQRRHHKLSRFSSHVRLSFGPSMDVLQRAMIRLNRILKL
jgi:N-succinyldiaminopimelate aminotransferase